MLGNFEKSEIIEVLKNLYITFYFSSYFQGNWSNRKANDVCKQPLKASSSLVFPALEVLQSTLGY